MKAWLFCGAKIVCVDAARTNNFDIPELSEGTVYTIRQIGPGDDIDPDVWLDGIIRRGFDPTDTPFRASRFRPVSTIDTTHAVEALRKITLNHRIDA